MPEKPCYTDFYHHVATYSVNAYDKWRTGSTVDSVTLTKQPPPGWNTPPKIPPWARRSCFAAGTPVWTERGLAPIEQIRPGDRVLSQDQDTGELRFQAVLATTVRPESPMVQIGAGDDALRATRGHPFWVAGRGWQMAKQLKTGDRLHGLHGTSRVEAIADAKEERAYNLVVDEFDTYFVGRRGLLVHDNVLRKPTPCVLPGVEKADLAEAAPAE